MIQVEKIFSDHMMLQRNCENRIYGKDFAHEKIGLLFRNQLYETVADGEGNWEIMLAPMQEGGPYSMLLLGSSQEEIKDILIGDLYFLSGQSNMEMKLTETIDVTKVEMLEEVSTIRFLSVAPNFIFQERKTVLPRVIWKRATKENFSDISAIGYFFALEISKNQKIPIGLIQTAVGGSSIEAWMKMETLNRLGNSCAEVAELIKSGEIEDMILEQMAEKDRWCKSLLQEQKPEKALWENLYLPEIIEPDSKKSYFGSIWLRKDFELKEQPVEDAFLRLGLMLEEGTVWVNNHYVGRALHRYEMLNFLVSKEILQVGINQIVIRLIIGNGVGGLVPKKPYYLRIGNWELDLSGIWQSCKGISLKKKMPNVVFPPLLPVGLFYGVLRPLRSFQFRAVLWYQGESNVGHPEDYKELFYEMKSDWEEEFKRPLSFCCVELANYQDPLNQITDTGWAKIRNDQRRCRKETGSDLDKVGVVTAMDVGEKTDLHPHNKEAVAKRISLWVRRHIYVEDVWCYGPLLSSYERKEYEIVLHFEYDDSTIAEISNFERLSLEGKWEPVKAIHRPGIVEIKIPERMQPKNYIRYAWYDNPGPLNFYNSAGLPAESFLIEFE